MGEDRRLARGGRRGGDDSPRSGAREARVTSEAASRADFSTVRYAQTWEDADVLLSALDIRPGDDCLAIASAGDNALAMLAREPRRVVAVDLNPAQLACVELRVAAYRRLRHPELLELLGARPSRRRLELYLRLRSELSPEARAFWDARPGEIARGAGSAGKFERFLSLFRRFVLPLTHSRRTVREFLAGGEPAARMRFYDARWDTWRWRLAFKLFFSRSVIGRFGRDPSFFRYVEGDVADTLLARMRDALTRTDPAKNPYLHWVLTGTHGEALPFALRPENFDAIRRHLDRLELRRQSLESYLDETAPGTFDRFNLSDVFEYMSEENSARVLAAAAKAARPGARLAYWNMLVPRSRPASLAGVLEPVPGLGRSLHLRDKAIFYSGFVVEQTAAAAEAVAA
ncbi:MAG: DUF3419 family protein [Elusimicrobia bacterium]|nr:DUF3419 family protein [Elusimicrobiota bacterium]